MVWRSSRARNLLNSGDTSNGRLITDYCYTSSEHESSEGEFVEAEKPWPPVDLARTSRSRTKVAALHVPRPHSYLFRKSDGRARGSKHSRRWENSMFLNSLHQIPEEELEEESNIVPPHSSPLTKLHNSDKYMQIWCSFTARSEEEQERIISSRCRAPVGVRTIADKTNSKVEEEEYEERLNDCCGGAESERSPEQCFKKVDRRIRSVLQHNKHLPTGLLLDLEEELRFFFSIDHGAVLVALQTNAFYRLLLHGVCQYMGLQSTTDQFEGCSLLVAECRANQFSPPTTTLSHFLQHRK